MFRKHILWSLVLLLDAGGGRAATGTAPDVVTDLSEAWQYTFVGQASGDLPPGDAVWQDLTRNSLPRGPGVAWLRINLPGASAADGSLYIERMFGNFTVFVDGRVLYEYGASDRADTRSALAFNSHLIRVGDAVPGSRLHVRVASIERRVGVLGATLYGSRGAIQKQLIYSSAHVTVTSLVEMLLGFTAFLAFCFLPNRREYLYFAVFSGGTGLYSLLFMPITNLIFFSSPRALDLSCQVVWLLVPVISYGINAFTAIVFGKGPLNSFIWIGRFWVVTGVAMGTCFITGFTSMPNFMGTLRVIPLVGFMTLPYLFGLAHIYYSKATARDDLKPLFVGIGAILLGALATVLKVLQIVHVPSGLPNIGVTLFILSLLYIVIKRLRGIYATNLAQAAERARVAAELAAAQKTKQILDSIEEGILTFDENFRVDDQFSAFLPKILKTTAAAIAGADVRELLLGRANLPSDTIDVVTASLRSSIGSSPISWTMNSHNLPSELSLNIAGEQRVVALEWAPVFGATQERVDRIMVSVRDLTEHRRLQLEVANQKAHTERTVGVITEMLAKNRASVRSFAVSAGDLAVQLATATGASLLDFEQMYRTAHTIKGQARMMGFAAIASAAHEFENRLGDAKNGMDPTGQDLRSAAASVSEHIAFYSNTMTNVMDGGLRNSEAAQDWSLNGFVADVLPLLKQTLDAARVPFAALTVDDRVLSWRSGIGAKLGAILAHGINNALDHGFILPGQRGRNLRAAHLQLSAHSDGNDVVIALEDNGAGLDLVKLAKLARERSTDPRIHDDPAEVLFLDGVSTAELVTGSSGRGVGLAAVRALVREQAGEVKIANRGEGGTRLELRFPRASVTDLALDKAA